MAYRRSKRKVSKISRTMSMTELSVECAGCFNEYFSLQMNWRLPVAGGEKGKGTKILHQVGGESAKSVKTLNIGICKCKIGVAFNSREKE